MDEKQLQALYNAMNQKLNLGDYNSFKAQLASDGGFRKAFYNEASHDLDLGDFDSFDKSVKKKEPGFNGFSFDYSGVTHKSKSDLVNQQREETLAARRQPPEDLTNRNIEILKEAKPKQPQIEDTDDPIGSALHPVQQDWMKARNEQFNFFHQYANQDQTKVQVSPELQQERNSQASELLTKERSAFNTLKETQNQIQNNLPYIQPKQAKDELNRLVKQSHPDAPDVDGLSIEQIDKWLPLNKAGNVNETAKYILSQYKENRSVSDALKNASTIKEAALNYAYYNDKNLYDQLNKAGGNILGSNNAAMGEAMLKFLSSPATQNWASTSPEREQAYRQSYDNLFKEYPSFGEKIIEEKLSQSREDKGLNNWFFNAPDETDAAGTDKLFNELVEKGELPKSAIPVYNKIRDNLKWRTPGLADNILYGLSKGVQDVESFIPDWFKSGEQSTYDALEKQYSQINFKPKGAVHDVTTGVGEFTGQMIPLMLITKGLTSAGVAPRLANAVSVGVVFEHPNRERAALLFPNNTSAQNLYTALSTALDIGVGSLYDRSQALDFLNKEIKPQITDVVKSLSKNEITTAAAEGEAQNIFASAFERAKDFGLKTAEHNLKQSAQMSGFTLAHNMLDFAFNKRSDLGTEDAVESGKTAFLYGGLLSAMAAHGEMNNTSKITASTIYDLARNPEYYKGVINRDVNLSFAERTERLSNLDKAVTVLKEIDQTDLTEKQKKNYLLQSLRENYLNQEIENTKDSVLKDKLKQQVKESKELRENILNRRDSQLERVAENQKEKINDTSGTEKESQTSETGTTTEDNGGSNLNPSGSEGGTGEAQGVQEATTVPSLESKFAPEHIERTLSEELPTEMRKAKVKVEAIDSDTGKTKETEMEARKAFKDLKTHYRKLEKIIQNCL